MREAAGLVRTPGTHPAAMSLSCGVSMRLAEAPDWPGRPATEYPNPADFRILMAAFRVTHCHGSDPPACGNSTPIDAPMFVKASF